jgi:hypothetical protein
MPCKACNEGNCCNHCADCCGNPSRDHSDNGGKPTKENGDQRKGGKNGDKKK